MTIALDYAARSDVGLVRSNNQDSAYAGPHLLVVADGMGGHAGGDVASSLAIARLARLDSDSPASDIVAHLEEAILASNDDILHRARVEPDLAGLGTTITALLRSGSKFALAHIGDSRAYLLRDDTVTQVTKDHTFVQRLMDEGRLTADEAEHHPQRSVLMRVLGDVDADPDLDLSLRPAHVGDRWLLCSDGLSGIVTFDTISRILTEYASPGEAADELVRLALAGGGPDNVTCVVADVVDLDALPPGAAGPSTAPQVVGSAASDRHRQTGGTGSAARAAALTRSPDPVAPYADEDYLDERPPGRRTWPVVAVLVLLVAALAALGALGWQWVKDQYFVGTDGQQVVVYQGISQQLGPLELFQEVEQTGLALDDLPPFYQDEVRGTIAAADQEGADRIVERLRGEVREPAPTPTAPPTAPPTSPATSPPSTADPSGT
jgi:PPM family protein phosphatase